MNEIEYSPHNYLDPIKFDIFRLRTDKKKFIVKYKFVARKMADIDIRVDQSSKFNKHDSHRINKLLSHQIDL